MRENLGEQNENEEKKDGKPEKLTSGDLLEPVQAILSEAQQIFKGSLISLKK